MRHSGGSLEEDMGAGTRHKMERDARAKRLAEALRANLKRRKAQQRERAGGPDRGDRGAEATDTPPAAPDSQGD